SALRIITSLFLFSCYVPPPPDTSPLSLHDALPICFWSRFGTSSGAIFSASAASRRAASSWPTCWSAAAPVTASIRRTPEATAPRSEEHTSELQSHLNLVCRLLLEKKKKTQKQQMHI